MTQPSVPPGRHASPVDWAPAVRVPADSWRVPGWVSSTASHSFFYDRRLLLPQSPNTCLPESVLVETQRRVPCSHPAPAWSWRGLGLPSFDKCGPVKIRLGGRLGLRRRRCVSSLDWETWEPFRAGCESRGNCTAGIVQWGSDGGPRRKWGRLPPRQLFPSNFPAAPVGRGRNWGLPFSLRDTAPPPPPLHHRFAGAAQRSVQA